VTTKTGSSPKQASTTNDKQSAKKDPPAKSAVVHAAATDGQVIEKGPAAPPGPADQRSPAVAASTNKEPLSIDLATALLLANVGNPTINLARERERQATSASLS
jgi:hypothetical protein